MTTSFHYCQTDEELAQACLFLLENKRDVHVAFSTMDMVSMFYTYTTQGHIIRALDTDNRVVGVGVYFLGTPEQEYGNQEVAFVDIVIVEKGYRGSRLFLEGVSYMVNQITEKHPKVQEFSLVALKENRYLCRLYSKFLQINSSREGALGEEIVFLDKISKVKTTLNRYSKV